MFAIFITNHTEWIDMCHVCKSCIKVESVSILEYICGIISAKDHLVEYCKLKIGHKERALSVVMKSQAHSKERCPWC